MSDFVRAVLINPRAEIDRTRFPFTLPVFKGALDYHFCESGINPIKYEDTDQYSLTRDVLNHSSRYMRQLRIEEV